MLVNQFARFIYLPRALRNDLQKYINTAYTSIVYSIVATHFVPLLLSSLFFDATAYHIIFLFFVFSVFFFYNLPVTA